MVSELAGLDIFPQQITTDVSQNVIIQLKWSIDYTAAIKKYLSNKRRGNFVPEII
jgi:hypothetical protein